MKLINWDCLEEMDKLIAEWIKVDAIITDPPYEFIWWGWWKFFTESNRKTLTDIYSKHWSKNKLDIWIDKKFLEKSKLLFNKWYNAIYFCSQYQLKQYLDFIQDNNFMFNLLVWNKTNPSPLCNNRYLSDLEYIIQIRTKEYKIYWDYFSKKKCYTSSLNTKDKKEFNHPTIKPLELINKFIINHTNKWDIVLDCFMWSWTTWVSCKNLNRDFIWIELDETYFNIAKERINKLNLF